MFYEVILGTTYPCMFNGAFSLQRVYLIRVFCLIYSFALVTPYWPFYWADICGVHSWISNVADEFLGYNSVPGKVQSIL